MDHKKKIYQLMNEHHIDPSSHIQIHIEKYPFDEGTVIGWINNEIRVVTKRASGLLDLLTITKDGQVGAEIIPNRFHK